MVAEDTDLPFDISQSRVIFFRHTDLTSAGKARDALAEQIEASPSAPPDNPISDGKRLAKLEGGNVEEQTLAVLMERVQRLGASMERIEHRLRLSESQQKSGKILRSLQLRSRIPSCWPKPDRP